MELELLARLRSAEGDAALAAAARASHLDPLRAATALRADGIDAPLASAALTQVRLRRRARSKLGPDAERLWFTRTGLEQATRTSVASRRAARLAAAGVTSIVDLGCGIGADTIALARAGMRVAAVEADPLTAAVAQSNVDALGLPVTIMCADATTVELSDADAVFCDPARRDVRRRFHDPHAYSPPWSFVVGLADRVPATVLKLAPGIDHDLLPPLAEAEWVSVDRDLVECTLWFGPTATVARRASVLSGAGTYEITGTGHRSAAVDGIRPYLVDPDPAVVRAHLVAEFAESIDGALADPHIAYVFTDQPVVSPYGRCFEIVEQLPFAVKDLRRSLRDRGIGRLEILKRGLGVDPDRLRHELRLAGPAGASLVLARLGDRPTALLCRPCR